MAVSDDRFTGFIWAENIALALESAHIEFVCYLPSEKPAFRFLAYYVRWLLLLGLGAVMARKKS